MKEPLLTIRLKPSTDFDGPGVSIHWKEPSHEIFLGDDDEVWDEGDQAWTKICNGIHALLSQVDFKGMAWEVEFDCPDSSPLIEKGLTRNQYHVRQRNIEE